MDIAVDLEVAPQRRRRIFLERMRKLQSLAEHYSDGGRLSDVREHEVRTFLVVPLLLALGWPETHLKIELPLPRDRGGRSIKKGTKGKADIAVFCRPYSRENNHKKGAPNTHDCVMIVEGKGFAKGLALAPRQAKEYASKTESCQQVLVTNGYCYKVFPRGNGGSFSQEPAAYLNIIDPRDRYPPNPDTVGGAVSLLKAISPGRFGVASNHLT